MLSFCIKQVMLAHSRLYRMMLVYWLYRIELQSVALLSPESQLELQILLREAHTASSNHSKLFEETDEVYTVSHQNNIVACVFLKAVDWCAVSDPEHAEADGQKMLKYCNVRALSVSSQHRRLGLASALIKLVQKKARAENMLWIELHVDEKKDKSHEWLLSMYRNLDFVVLPRPQRREYLLLNYNY